MEIYDDDTLTGTPAPILLRHVNSRPKRPDHADEPGEALALCLDETGQVDMGVLARILRCDETEVLLKRIRERGPSICPRPRRWVTTNYPLQSRLPRPYRLPGPG